MKITFEFIISATFMIVGLIGVVVFLHRKDALMLAASVFLVCNSLFFEMIQLKRHIRYVEDSNEVYHDTYMKLLNKKG